MAKVLVVGGAGYVGSATVHAAIDRGFEVVVLDDLSTGLMELCRGARFILGEAGDAELVAEICRAEAASPTGPIDACFHFAAKALVEESTRLPELYFQNNVTQTERLVDALLANGVKRFVFSSTCSIFGDQSRGPLHEELPFAPKNPYAETKLVAERALEARAPKGLQAIALRYFNAAGAENGGRSGECHDPETHLIPKLLEAAASGDPVPVFGSDYPTRDGTCVRDYVHVSDLADAHLAAFDRLKKLPEDRGGFERYNLGTGSGHSVKEVIAAVERVSGTKLNVQFKDRRPGDPAELVADSSRARAALGFQPSRSLEQVIRDAVNWQKKRESLRPAVFLDRDGTLNPDPGYIRDPEQLTLFKGVPQALKRLSEAGYLTVITSNQSGVGRGLIKAGELPRVSRRFLDLLAREGSHVDHLELCVHRPEEGCSCRKPEPGLLLKAAKKLGIDLKRSIMIGDRASDLAAGKNAGVSRVLLVRTGDGKETEAMMTAGSCDEAFEDLSAATDWILKK